MGQGFQPPIDKGQNRYFDISYGLASVAITTGVTIVTTTGANYHGFALISGATATATIKVYDHISTTSGNYLDLYSIAQTQAKDREKYIPVVAKDGIVVSLTGTGSEGAIFYGPKG